MELARTLRELFRHRVLLAVGVVLAIGIAAFGVKGGTLKHSSASTQVLVDAKASVLGSVNQPFEPLASRAQVYANFMASPSFLDEVGRRVGLQGDQIFAAGPVNANEPRVEQEPTALKRNVQLTGETKPYRLNYESQLNLPTIGIYSQAPTTAQAVALANAAATSLQKYVASVESSAGIPEHSQIVIRQLGPAAGAVDDGGIGKTIAALVFIVVLAVWCLLILLGTRFRESWRASAAMEGLPEIPHGSLHGGWQPSLLPEPAAGAHEPAPAPPQDDASEPTTIVDDEVEHGEENPTPVPIPVPGRNGAGRSPSPVARSARR